MAFVQRAMVFFMVMAALQGSLAAVYKVGESAGWTTIGNVDYKKWAASKTFHVGDIILFEYNAQFHNVMQVRHTDYQQCNTTAPLLTYTTGNESISIKRNGHYYFLCGIPGHCQAGQKVDIRVVRVSATAPTPALSPTSSATVPGATATAPGGSPTATGASATAPVPSHKNSASLPSKGFLGQLAMALIIFAGFAY